MSGLDVEALLDSTAVAASGENTESHSKDARHHEDRSHRRDSDRRRDRSHDRERDRRHRSRERGRKDGDGDEAMNSPGAGSASGTHRSNKRRSRSPDSDRRHSHRHHDSAEKDDLRRGSGGDFYRGGGRARTRSRSPEGDQYYRPTGRGGRRDDGDRTRDRSPKRERNGGRRRTPSPKRAKSKSATPQPTEDERDRRTVFVQQLANRLRSKELIAFFEKVGPVREAQIVKDRVSGRSKGFVHVEHV